MLLRVLVGLVVSPDCLIDEVGGFYVGQPRLPQPPPDLVDDAVDAVPVLDAMLVCEHGLPELAETELPLRYTVLAVMREEGSVEAVLIQRVLLRVEELGWWVAIVEGLASHWMDTVIAITLENRIPLLENEPHAVRPPLPTSLPMV